MGIVIVQNAVNRSAHLAHQGKIDYQVLAHTIRTIDHDIPHYLIVNLLSLQHTITESDMLRTSLKRALAFMRHQHLPHTLIVITDDLMLTRELEYQLANGLPVQTYQTLAAFEKQLNQRLVQSHTHTLDGPTHHYRDQLRLQMVQYEPQPVIPFPKNGLLVFKAIINGHTIETPIQEELFVGRKTAAPYPIDIDLTPWRAYQYGVSRQHARFDLEPDGALYIVDLGSINGTAMHGNRLDAFTPYRITHGDMVCLGYMLLEIGFKAPAKSR